MQNATANTMSVSRSRQWLPLLALAAMMAVLAEPAQAQDIATVICNVVIYILNGPLGRAIATLAVIIIGINAQIGRTSWTTALIVATGVAVVFGARGIVSTITGMPAVC